MIEIIALILLTRSIGKLALQKGQRPGRWKLNTVLWWISFEFIGAFIGLAISHNIVSAAFLGLGFGFGGYLLAKYQLDKLPDARSNSWIDQIGSSDNS